MARTPYTLNSYTGEPVAALLTNSIGATDTSISLTFSTGIGSWVGLGVGGGFFLAFDYNTSLEEHVYVPAASYTWTNSTVTLLNVVRAYDTANVGTGVAHAANASVVPIIGVTDISEANYAVSQTVGLVQATGDLLIGSGSNSLSRLPIGTAGQTIVVNPAGTSLSYTNVAGSQGAQGTQGSQGYQGAQGNQGAQGSQGTQGNDGTQGTQGTQGYQGYQGNQGNQGSVSGPIFTGGVTGTDFNATGLTGATTATRYVGGTANGAPTSGTFSVGDFIIDQTGTIWVCTTAGTPGTWTTTISSHLSLRSASATVGRNEITLFSGSTASQTLTAPSNPIDGSNWTVINKSSVSVTLSFTPSMIALGSSSGVTTFSVPANGSYSFVNYNGSQWYMVASNSTDQLIGTLPVANGGTGSAYGVTPQQQAFALGGASNVAETFPRLIAINSNTYSIPHFQAVYLYAGQIVNSVKFATSSTAGSALTSQWVGLFNSSGLCMAIGPQSLTTMAANTLFNWSLSSAYTVPTTGLYYVGIGIYGTTSPVYPTLVAGAGGNGGGTLIWGQSPVLQYTSGSAATVPTVGTTTFTPVLSVTNGVYSSLQ